MTGGRLLTYFTLTYAVSWILFVGAAALVSGTPGPAPEALFIPGAFGPALVALFLVAGESGRAGIANLMRGVTKWRVPLRWYGFALLFMPVIKLTVAVLVRAFTGSWPKFGGDAWYVMLLGIAVSMWFQIGEELGWRGFALPRLNERFGLAPASLLLGVIWATWHLPFFFIPGVDKTGQSFPLYVLQVTALSVAIAYVYWRTEGSLLLVMLMHAAINNTLGIVPSVTPNRVHVFSFSGSLVGWLTCGLLWVCAAYFLAMMARATHRAGVERAAPRLATA